MLVTSPVTQPVAPPAVVAVVPLQRQPQKGQTPTCALLQKLGASRLVPNLGLRCSLPKWVGWASARRSKHLPQVYGRSPDWSNHEKPPYHLRV